MKRTLLSVLTLLLLIAIPSEAFSQKKKRQKVISKIAFGSCAEQDKPLPVFDIIVKHKPDLFIFLGDNIYADTNEEAEFRKKYQQLADHPPFQNLKKNVPIIATWDDHDFGDNDAGKDYKKKNMSRDIFFDFFGEPKDSERRKHEGVYTSYMHEFKGKKLQIILLDTRYFRDDLRQYMGEVSEDKRYFYKLDYAPHEGDKNTMLGDAQWQWLEKELQQKADIRLIGSGTQFGPEFNGYETWANFPSEQKRMLELIKKTKASGVMFLTGDVHYAEISKMEEPDLYPIYDVTASGLSSTWKFATPNKNRIEGPVMDNHFGLLTIDWNKKDPSIKAKIWDVNNNQRIEYTIRKSEISFKK